MAAERWTSSRGRMGSHGVADSTHRRTPRHDAGTAVARQRYMPGEGFAAHWASAVEAMVEGALRRDSGVVEDGSTLVLEWVAKAVTAQTATLIVWNRAMGTVLTTISAGELADVVAREFESNPEIWLYGDTQWEDVEIRHVARDSELRSQGVASLLRVTLPPRGETVGALLLGVPETSPREGREASGRRVLQRWTRQSEAIMHCLDTVRWCTRLSEGIATLAAQQDARTQMVSLVAHDIRGSLSTAKLAAQLLAHDMGGGDGLRQLAEKIDTNIDRTERLVRDLLDANRVHSGRQLSVRRRRCDLSAVVRDVSEHLRVAYGDRFAVDVPNTTFGDWDPDQLHRVIWNLATVAAKHTALATPIAIALTRDERCARLVVHPVPAGTGEAQGSTPRTDLGLALAVGGARAHGGRVDVRHDRSGNIVTLVMPLHSTPVGVSDARHDERPSC
jgi:signal transduction histidine kinase